MKWPFGGKAKPFLDPETEAWHLETWAWLMTNLGGMDVIHQHPLVLADRSFFPPSEAEGHERVQDLFDHIRDLCGMSDWEVDLVAQPQRPQARVSEFVTLQAVKEAMPLGTFGPEGNSVMITYDPALLDDPVALVATLTHELAHYLLSTIPTDPPGGPEMEEFATDLAVAYLDFGLFGANVAFRYAQHQDYMAQGYAWSRHGYLSEREWAFAVAMYLQLRDEHAVIAKAHLKPSLYVDTMKAWTSLEQRPELVTALKDIA